MWRVSGNRQLPTVLLLLLQAVGLQSGYHTAIVMGGLNYKVHGLRLAQANEMQLELKAHGQGPKGAAATTHMQLDGEPWVQELPQGGDATPMQVSCTSLHPGQSLNCCITPQVKPVIVLQ